MGEAETLPSTMSEFGLGDPIVIHIDCDEETSVRRITHRKICSNCGRTFTPQTAHYDHGICDACGHALIQREDDSEPIVRARYKEYQHRIAALLDYYKRQGYPIITYHTGIDGPDADFQTLQTKLDEIGVTI